MTSPHAAMNVADSRYYAKVLQIVARKQTAVDMLLPAIPLARDLRRVGMLGLWTLRHRQPSQMASVPQIN